MSLGVTALGGASIPEYGVATIVSIFIATRTGVSTWRSCSCWITCRYVNTTIGCICKICKYFFCSLGTKIIASEKIVSDASSLYLICIYLEFEICNSCYCGEFLIFGAPLVNLVTKAIPTWFTTGLEVAGNMLPVLGVGLLLHYMPVKKHLSFLIVGFVLSVIC